MIMEKRSSSSFISLFKRNFPQKRVRKCKTQHRRCSIFSSSFFEPVGGNFSQSASDLANWSKLPTRCLLFIHIFTLSCDVINPHQVQRNCANWVYLDLVIRCTAGKDFSLFQNLWLDRQCDFFCISFVKIIIKQVSQAMCNSFWILIHQ